MCAIGNDSKNLNIPMERGCGESTWGWWLWPHTWRALDGRSLGTGDCRSTRIWVSLCSAGFFSSQPTVFFSHIKSTPATSQRAVIFSHNKLAPATSHSQQNRVYEGMERTIDRHWSESVSVNSPSLKIYLDLGHVLLAMKKISRKGILHAWSIK